MKTNCDQFENVFYVNLFSAYFMKLQSVSFLLSVGKCSNGSFLGMASFYSFRLFTSVPFVFTMKS